MVPIVKSSNGNWLTPVFAGLVYAMLVAGTATVLLSFILAVTGLKEQSLPVYVYMIHGMAVLVGGFITARRAGEKGWYRGGLLGILYGLIVTLVSYLGFDASLTLKSLLFLAVCFVTGAFGGIMGINSGR